MQARKGSQVKTYESHTTNYKRDSGLESVVTFEDVPGSSLTAHSPQHRRGSLYTKKSAIENTYRMEPKRKFPSKKVENLIKQVLQVNLCDKVYDSVEDAQIVKALSNEIKRKVMEMRLLRYKYIVVVTIGQKYGQKLTSTSRCLWDTGKDNFASASYENKSLFAVANCYAVYYE